MLILSIVSTGETVFKPLMKHLLGPYSSEGQFYIKEIQQVANEEFKSYFTRYHDDAKRQKLGLTRYASSSIDEQLPSDEQRERDGVLWNNLCALLQASQCDYTIFFRELSSIDKHSTLDQAVERIFFSSHLKPAEVRIICN